MQKGEIKKEEIGKQGLQPIPYKRMWKEGSGECIILSQKAINIINTDFA